MKATHAPARAVPAVGGTVRLDGQEYRVLRVDYRQESGFLALRLESETGIIWRDLFPPIAATEYPGLEIL